VADLGKRLTLLRLGESPSLETILTTAYQQEQFHISPDGRHVAYRSAEPGQSEIYIAAFPSFAVKRVSSDGAFYAEWAKGGRELYYRADIGRRRPGWKVGSALRFSATLTSRRDGCT
jgi:hypothetical protein